MNEKSMFVGPYQVLLNVILEEKLNNGEDLVELTLKDKDREFKEVMTRTMFESIVKESPTDLTTLRDNRIFPVVSETLNLLLKWGLKVDEMDFFMASLTNSVNHSLQSADAKVWGKHRSDITLVDLDRILRKMTVEDILDNKPLTGKG